MTYTIAFEEIPKQKDIEILSHGISQNAKQKRGLNPVVPFAFFIRNENNKIMGGFNGNIGYDWLYVDQLWADESLRGKGYGTALMRAAEKLAIDLAITWTLFKDQSRVIFKSKLGLDNHTWLRAKAWTLWKALITVAGFTNPNNVETKQCCRDEIKIKYGQRIGDNIVCPFIVYFQNKTIGFIQYYWTSKVGDGWWPNEDDYTVGIDQFIGERDYINKGYGTEMLKSFVAMLFSNPNIHKIITEADPKNFRAQRCYEKVGFKKIGIIHTPDGESVLYELLINPIS